jgi:hypothetical protein
MNGKGWGKRCWCRNLRPLSRQNDKTENKKFVETTSGQSFFPNMKQGCHPAKYDAWYQIKDYMLNFNNEKSNCPTLWLYRNIWHGLQIHNIYDDDNVPDTVSTKDILNTKQQCNPPATTLFLVVTADRGTHITLRLAMVWRSTGLSNSFLFLCAYGSNTWISPWNLRLDNIQHSILGNILIYKPLFTLHFMHMFKLCINFQVLQILFVNNKSWLNICRVNFHPLSWLSLCTAVLNLRCKSARNNWIIYWDQLVLKEVKGGSDHCATLSFNQKNQSKPYTNLSKFYQMLWPKLTAVSLNPSH